MPKPSRHRSSARRLAAAAVAAAALLAAAPAAAELCALDAAPGATLLLPWFEVDLDHFSGPTTVFSIVNAAAETKATRVTVWSDLGVPVMWFEVLLTGWDVQTINLRDVLAGNVPSTGVDSPVGFFSVDVEVPGCDETLPPAPFPPAAVAEVRAALTGQPSPLDGLCAGLDHGDGLARGFVTVDVVRRCSDTPPGPGYFGAGGELAYDNVLLGDFFVVDPSNDSAWGEGLVRLEADPELFAPGARSFYQGWSTALTTSDGREPLPTVWSTRYLAGGAFDAGSEAIVWRDPGEPGVRFTCHTLQDHPWFPLTSRALVMFDEEEDAAIPEPCVILCPPEFLFLRFFPAQANRVLVGGPDLPVPFSFGWLIADLRPGSAESPPRQAWMGLVATAEGRYGVGFDASPLDGPCTPGEYAAPQAVP